MNRMNRATSGDLQRVADLANLELTEQEKVSLLRDLNLILDHVAQLNELDTLNVPAMAQVAEAVVGPNPQSLDSETTLRNDLCVASLDRAVVMACAPDSDGTYFLVPKVIER